MFVIFLIYYLLPWQKTTGDITKVSCVRKVNKWAHQIIKCRFVK